MPPNLNRRLRQFIVRYYDLSELKVLCSDLDINYENLGGDNRIDDKANQLLREISKKRLFNELLDILHRDRSRAFDHEGLGDVKDVELYNFPSQRNQQFLKPYNSDEPKQSIISNYISDRYELREELGRGTSATVYKGFDNRLRRLVAIKVLHEYWQNTPQFVKRFKHEAEYVAKLRHPNIVNISDYGQNNKGRPYIVMDYISGATLEYYLENSGVLELTQAIRILEYIASAVDYAHSENYIHRDLKPANIMITEQMGVIVAILTDFGLAKAMAASIASTMQFSNLVGSPEYMAPEQADPKDLNKVGPAADRYAFGVLAYKMLTGRVPFVGDNIMAIIYGHVSHKPPQPKDIQPDLSETVNSALLRMLAKEPEARFPTCHEFVKALKGFPKVETRTARNENENESGKDEWDLVLTDLINGARTLVYNIGEAADSTLHYLASLFNHGEVKVSNIDARQIQEIDDQPLFHANLTTGLVFIGLIIFFIIMCCILLSIGLLN